MGLRSGLLTVLVSGALAGIVWTLSRAEGIPGLVVLRNMLVGLGRGLAEVTYTPWTLLLAVLIPGVSDRIVYTLQVLASHVKRIGPEGVDFREPTDVDVSKLSAVVSNSRVSTPLSRQHVEFFKLLLTITPAMAIARYLLYAIYLHRLGPRFSAQDLATAAFGARAWPVLSNTSRDSLLIPASILVMSGAIQGSIQWRSGWDFEFNGISISPAARRALEELEAEGYVMVPHVYLPEDGKS